MTREQERRGALEAIERILNRGGERVEVVREVLIVLQRLEPSADISFLTHGSGASSEREDAAFFERVALLASPYVR